jgi:Ala-tRNA(Pro) deacylase
MVPDRVAKHLQSVGASFSRHRHPWAVTAQELAQSMGVGGYHVAKAVLVEAGGRTWMAVLPAPDVVDVDRLRRALGAPAVRLLREEERTRLFPDCEPGAEPPFGSLYGVSVVVAPEMAQQEHIVFCAGSHDEAMSMSYAEYVRIEQPLVADFAAAPTTAVEPAAHP